MADKNVSSKNVSPFQMDCNGIKVAGIPPIEIEINYFGRDRKAGNTLNKKKKLHKEVCLKFLHHT